jgi:hypothetical protein
MHAEDIGSAEIFTNHCRPAALYGEVFATSVFGGAMLVFSVTYHYYGVLFYFILFYIYVKWILQIAKISIFCITRNLFQ